jgi:hypothetical protein
VIAPARLARSASIPGASSGKRSRCSPLALALLLSLGAAGCAREAPAAPASGARGRDPDGAALERPHGSCAEGFARTGDERADLDELARRCHVGPRLGPAARAVQADTEAVQRFALEAGGPGRCYRVLAVGGVGVLELGLVVRGPEGGAILASQGAGSRGVAVLPPDAALCLPDEARYTVEVGVTKGRGAYVVEMRAEGQAAR